MDKVEMLQQLPQKQKRAVAQAREWSVGDAGAELGGVFGPLPSRASKRWELMS